MAKQMIDVGLDDNEDLAMIAGDFFYVEGTPRHQTQLILNNKGEFKQYTTLCVGVLNYLNDENFQALVRAISIEFSRDGIDVQGINIGRDGIVRSDAFYK
jgi:hypothetical protein